MFLSPGARARPNRLQLLAPRGTQIIFQQTAAPLFWTRITTNDDALLRIVGSAAVTTGGTNGFTATFNTQTVTGGHSLSNAELASHNHGITDPTHTHGINSTGQAQTGGPLGVPGTLTSVVSAASATGITINNDGSGTAHTHTITTDIKYVDIICCRKS